MDNLEIPATVRTVVINNPGSVFNGMTGVMVESDRPGWVKVQTEHWLLYTLEQFVKPA